MAAASVNQHAAEIATGELYDRFSPELDQWCRKNFYSYKEDIEELVMRTFERAKASAPTFKFPEHASTPELRSKSIRFWLFTILRHILCDVIRSEHNERGSRPDIRIEDVRGPVRYPPPAPDVFSPLKRLRLEGLDQFIAGLETNDLEILYSYIEDYSIIAKGVVLRLP
jgi:DNA-directed RNA polymerase specialized sigma24 family protein